MKTALVLGLLVTLAFGVGLLFFCGMLAAQKSTRSAA